MLFGLNGLGAFFMSAMKKSEFAVLSILFTRVPVAGVLLFLGAPTLAIGLLAGSEFLLIAAAARS